MLGIRGRKRPHGIPLHLLYEKGIFNILYTCQYKSSGKEHQDAAGIPLKPGENHRFPGRHPVQIQVQDACIIEKDHKIQ